MKSMQFITRTRPALLAIMVVLLLVPSVCAKPRFKVLHRFYAGKNNNGGLWAGLTLAKDSTLYGTTWGGGIYGRGTVFQLVRSAKGRWSEKVLHSFNDSDGLLTYGSLFLDSGGNLYGATDVEVFKMAPSSTGWNFSILENNYGSRAGVILDQAGNVYGNIGPGEYNEGAVTELVRGSEGWTQSYLYSFCRDINSCPDGDGPVSGVVFDAAGNLYGTTEYGGTGQGGDYGTAYELQNRSDGTWQHIVLHSFPAFEGDGMRLLAGLVLDRSGNLYGATIQGGSIGCGMVFKLTHGAKGWKESVVHDFAQPTNGCGPSGVTFDQAGNLYGTAGGGTGQCEAGCGVAFKLTPDSGGRWKYSVLHHFTGNDGAYPDAGVILDKKGNLYGTTELGGGGSSVGVVFEIAR